jgi:hypothetical protein
MAGPSAEDSIVEAAGAGTARPLYLVTGEPVLAEAAARRIALALAQPIDGRFDVHRRPPDLGAVLADLRTYSLFGGGKISLVIDCAALSDRRAAAYLIDQAAEALPLQDDVELTGAARHAAGRLLQVCRFFGLQPGAAPSSRIIEGLPTWVFEGAAPSGGANRGASGGAARARGKRRPKGAIEELKTGLVTLLDAAQRDGVAGWADTDATELAR